MQLLPHVYQVGGSLSGLTEGQVLGPFDDCNTYALDLGDQIVLVDCGNGTSWPQIQQNLRMWGLEPNDISTVFITHPHYDHANGAYLAKSGGAMLCASGETASALSSGDERCCGYLYHARFHPVFVDRIVENGEKVVVGNLSVEAICLPGHSAGCTAYAMDFCGNRLLFSGDVIGTLGYGHFGWNGSIDFDKKTYLQSLLTMSKLEFDVMLPGHGLCSFHDPRMRVEVSLNEALMNWR